MEKYLKEIIPHTQIIGPFGFIMVVYQMTKNKIFQILIHCSRSLKEQNISFMIKIMQRKQPMKVDYKIQNNTLIH